MIIKLVVMGFTIGMMCFAFGLVDLINNAGDVVYTYAFFYAFFIAFMILLGLVIGIIFRLRVSGSWHYFDKPKKNRPLLEFLYRDGSKRPVLGSRIPGMGLFSVLGLGLVLDIGRLPAPGSVYFHGDKPIRFVLQDINHTPNPKFAGFYPFLTKLGFNRADELQDVINGYSPELMVKVWNRLVDYKPKTASDRIVENIQEMNDKEKKSFDKAWDKGNKKRGMREKIDNILKRKG